MESKQQDIIKINEIKLEGGNKEPNQIVWWVRINITLLICTLLAMIFQYNRWLPIVNEYDTYAWALALTAMVTFLISVVYTIFNFRKIENSKSGARKRIEKFSLVLIIFIWLIALAIHVNIPDSSGYKNLIFSILLGLASGLFVKLLEKELELLASKNANALGHTTVVSSGILFMSLGVLGGKYFEDLSLEYISIVPYFEMFAFACLSFSSAILFIHVSKYYDKLLIEKG